MKIKIRCTISEIKPTDESDENKDQEEINGDQVDGSKESKDSCNTENILPTIEEEKTVPSNEEEKSVPSNEGDKTVPSNEEEKTVNNIENNTQNKKQKIYKIPFVP